MGTQYPVLVILEDCTPHYCLSADGPKKLSCDIWETFRLGPAEGTLRFDAGSTGAARFVAFVAAAGAMTGNDVGPLKRSIRPPGVRIIVSSESGLPKFRSMLSGPATGWFWAAAGPKVCRTVSFRLRRSGSISCRKGFFNTLGDTLAQLPPGSQ